MLAQQHIKAPGARGHLTVLLNAIAVGCKFVSSSVRKVCAFVGVPVGGVCERWTLAQGACIYVRLVCAWFFA